MIKVSIIIPYYMKNRFQGRMSKGHSPIGRSYLSDCLMSVCDQNRGDLEVILIEDGASEDISEVIEEFRARLNIRTLRIAHAGTAAARNAGLDAAQGEYVYFLDADDYLKEGTIGRLLDAENAAMPDLIYGSKERTWFKRLSYLEECRMRERTPEPDDFTEPSAYLVRRSASVLNILIRREFLQKNGIRFDESLVLYSDMPFTAALLANAKHTACDYDAVYVKRIHNDEVQYPSLDQAVRKDRTEQYVRAYRSAKEAAAGDEVLCRALDSGLGSYVLKAYTGRLHDRGKVVFGADEFALLREAMGAADMAAFRELPRMRRNVLKAVREGNNRKAQRIGNIVVSLKKRRELVKDSKLFFRIIDRYLFQKLPIKENLVFFESFFGNSYSDSPKYIYRYLQEHSGAEYQYVWVMKNKKTRIPGNPVVVKPFSLSYFYYLARAKYWVINIRLPKWIEKKKGHVFLQTWHGTPLKKLVFDMEDVHLASSKSSYKMIFYQETRNWDYLISANPFSTDAFESAFLYDREKILEIGYPRNDCLKAPDRDEHALAIKQKLGLPLDKKLILYAPTWRDDEYFEAGRYKFDLKLNLAQMRERLGGEYAVLLRTHYLIAQNLRLDRLEGFAYNVSEYDDISELYLVSDLCITDYSSVFFDYANLRRPILFYVYDLEKYRDVLRGFYIDIEKEVPGPLLYTTDEVIEAIEKLEDVNESYKERYDRFYERFCSLDDGHAAERAVKAVFGK